jgi:phospholipid transport system substrate-binding protein
MKTLGKLCTAALVLAFGSSAVAGEDTANAFMKGRQAELAALVKKGGQTESVRKVETIFDSMLDYDALAQRSLRDHWAARSEVERREFQDTLKRLVQRAYRKNLDRTAAYDVRFEGETRADDAFLVRTVAQSRTNAREEPISIDYVVRKIGGAWRIQDIVTEGSSLVNNYHQQFNRIIKKDGFAELLRRMKNKLETGSS